MRCKTVYDLVGVPQLLRGEKGVVENPVVLLPVLMIAPQQINSRVKEFEHFVAPLDTFCPFFDIRTVQIRPCSIDGIQEMIYGCSIVNLELRFKLVHHHLQTVRGVAIVL